MNMDIQIYPMFGKFSAVVSINKLSISFSLYTLSGTPVMHTLFLLMSAHKSRGLSSFLFILFPPLINFN